MRKEGEDERESKRCGKDNAVQRGLLGCVTAV